VVTVLDLHRRITFTSGAVEAVFSQAAGQLTGRRLSELVHPDDQAGIPDPTALPPGQTLVHLCRIGAEGDWRYIESTATNLLADPDVAGVVLNSRDISDRKALEQQLTHQAFHDPLTGLANRALFNDRLSHTLSRQNRTGESLAVLILDLDDFKVVNDSLGHHAGDDLARRRRRRRTPRRHRAHRRHRRPPRRRRVRRPARRRRRPPRVKQTSECEFGV